MKTIVRRTLALGMALVVMTGFTAAAPKQKTGSRSMGAGDSTIEGEILAVGGKEGAASALLTAIHLEGAKTYMVTADSGGHFSLSGLPRGYFTLAIVMGDKLHVGNTPVFVGPKVRQKVDIVLTDAVPLENGDPVVVPVLDQQANAGAEVKGLYQKPFLKTKSGMATLIGSILAALLILK